MNRLLARTLAVKQNTLVQRRRKRILLPVLDTTHSDLAHCSRSHRSARRRQRGQGKTQPFAEGIFIIDIAITTIRHALATQDLKPCVDILPGLTKFLIRSVTQGAHGITQTAQGNLLAHQAFVKTHRRFGRFAIAPGRDDDQQISYRRQTRRLDLGHVFHHRLKTTLLGILHRTRRKRFGVAGFGPVQNRQLARGNDRRCPRPSRTHARQEPTQPRTLRGIGRGKHRFQRLTLFFGEGGVIRKFKH